MMAARPYVIAELGINHNGSVDIARQMVRAAHAAGASAVKIQIRTPEICVPASQRERIKDTPWGRMTYLDYKRRLELSADSITALARLADALGLHFSASTWDLPSLGRLEHYSPPWVKIPSAKITDLRLVEAAAATGRVVVLSTGMSTAHQIDAAASLVSPTRLALLVCCSAYPAPVAELGLRRICTLRDRYPGAHVGYSGHETGLATTVAAVALGATIIERHITLDRSMWGTDQAASVEPDGLRRLVRDCSAVAAALGDGELGPSPSEAEAIARLRGA